MATTASQIAVRFYDRRKKKKRKTPNWTDMGKLNAQAHELVLGVVDAATELYFEEHTGK